MKWTEDEIKYLIDNYENNSNEYLSTNLHRTKASIDIKASRLKLNKSKEHISNLTTTQNKIKGRNLNLRELKRIALLYKTKGQFRENDNSAYTTAIKIDILNDICTHMIPQSYSTPQLICKYIFDMLIGEECIYNTRKVIKPYELDLYYPDYKLAIEYNGKYWHSDEFSDKTNLKQSMCNKLGIELLIIDEDSRNYEKDIKNYIINILPKLNKILNKNIKEIDITNIEINSSIYEQLIDKEYIIRITAKYTKFSTFKKEENRLFNKLYKLKLLDRYTSHMRKKKF